MKLSCTGNTAPSVGHGSGPSPIAITGIACRFPGAYGPEEFWRLLRNGVDAVGTLPPDRFDARSRAGFPSPHGGFLDEIAAFDAEFFGMSPREARQADPQLRLFLETAWEAIEDAGMSPEQLAGTRTGVFAGQATSNYWDLLAQTSGRDIYGITGSEVRAAVPGSVSYALDLRGPSISVDTACSASLAAVHLACQSLRLGECTAALVGGVNIILMSDEGTAYSQAGMLAADGRCKFGDISADGFVRSEGVGVVLLRPLAAALADGDRIYAVIRGTAMTNDGRSGGSAMAPGIPGQEEMLRRAYADARIAPADVDYVEAHGTGTSVGDPVELTALGRVLRDGRPPGRPCLVGSVKSNIGHTEAAAGIAGLIKAALCLHHRLVPPTLHVRTPQPELGSAELPIVLPTRPRELHDSGRPAVAGVSAFGISGTNVHVVLGEHRARPRPPSGPPPGGRHVLVLSARTLPAVREAASAAAEFIGAGGPGRAYDLGDLCHTAALRRRHHETRLAVVGRDHDELTAGLRAFACGMPHDGVVSGEDVLARKVQVAFVFPGQGSQWPGMGRDLLKTSKVFGEALARCDEAVRRETGWSVLRRIEDGAELRGTAEIQPTLWATQVALAELWRSLGLRPDALIGHSMGEVAAACVSGALSLRDGAAVICRRSGLADRADGRGAMAVVGLPEAGARAAIAGHEDEVAVAAVNGPTSVVLSGDRAALEKIMGTLRAAEVFCRLVRVDFASHSPQMDGLLSELRGRLADVSPRRGSVPIHSTVLDRFVDGSRFDADYWTRNLREPVRFASAILETVKFAPTIFVEISPHPILVSAIRDGLAECGAAGVATGSLRRAEPAWPELLTTLTTAHTVGAPVDWSRLYRGGRPVRLPTYPWQRKRYWMDEPAHADAIAGPAPVEFTGTVRLLDAAGTMVTEMPGMTMQFVADGIRGGSSAPAHGSVREAAAALTSVEAMHEVQTVAEAVTAQLRLVLGLVSGQLNPRRSLPALGLDSLMATQLAERLRAAVGVSVPARDLLTERPLAELIRELERA